MSGKFIKISDITSKKFCAAPFVASMLDTTQHFRVCCENEIQQLESTGLTNYKEQIWESEWIQKIRSDMINGNHVDGCEGCYNQEEKGSASDRMFYNNEFIKEDTMFSIETGTDLGKPLSYDLRADALCNLKCVMCGPSSSSQILKEENINLDILSFSQFMPINKHFLKHDGHVPVDDKIYDEIFNYLVSTPNVDLKLLGGEPSLISYYIKLLTEMTKVDMPRGRLHITSNLTNINKNLIDLMLNWKGTVEINASIDGMENVAEWIRYPINWSLWERNFETLRKLNILVIPHVVVQLFNVYQLPQFTKWFLDRGVVPHFTIAYEKVGTIVDIKRIPLKDRLRIADQLEEVTVDLKKDDRINSKLPTVTGALRDPEEFLSVSQSIHLTDFIVKKDIMRGLHIKDYIPEIYNLIKTRYDFVKDAIIEHRENLKNEQRTI